MWTHISGHKELQVFKLSIKAALDHLLKIHS